MAIEAAEARQIEECLMDGVGVGVEAEEDLYLSREVGEAGVEENTFRWTW